MSRSQRWPFVVVANRLPVRRSKSTGGWTRSPGGLVAALGPIVGEAKGAWVGWAGNVGQAPRPFVHEGITNVAVPISQDEVKAYYRGFCNSTLWPLYHDAIRNAEYHREWWRAYVEVNQRFARLTADHCAEGAKVWVQDYHLQLVPMLLRQQRPDLRIGFFLHTPFPPIELFVRLPWRREILDGLLGADVIGLQTEAAARNFLLLTREYAAGTPGADSVMVEGRTVRVSAFPISIDFHKYENAAKEPAVVRRAEQLRSRLDLGRKIILGVDRLDYTKGIDNRLEALRDVLSSGRKTIEDCVMVQVAVPSRERVGEYRMLRREVEELVGQINGQYGDVGRAAIYYTRRNLPLEELVAMYRAADVMLVTPLVDGMNLVAKEYVATRWDETGVLILSEFAGAAQELDAALLVNPHDVDGIASAIEQALDMSPDEAKARMHAMREHVRTHDVFDWAESFMTALGRDD